MRKLRSYFGMLLFAITVLFGANINADAADTMKVSVINVGQGSATLIQNHGVNTLVDTGTKAKYTKLNTYLKKAGVKKLDNLVITHPDIDHMGGAGLLITDYDVKNFYTTDYSSTSREYNDMIHALEQKDIEIQYVSESDIIRTGTGSSCKVLSPYYDEY